MLDHLLLQQVLHELVALQVLDDLDRARAHDRRTTTRVLVGHAEGHMLSVQPQSDIGVCVGECHTRGVTQHQRNHGDARGAGRGRPTELGHSGSLPNREQVVQEVSL